MAALMGEVVIWKGITKLDLPAQRVLQQALDGRLETAIVIGFDSDGEFYFASNKADGGEVIWLLELAKKKLLEVGEE